MATKFKPGDIVKITGIGNGSAWFEEPGIIGSVIKIEDIKYFKDRKSYFISGTMLIGSKIPNLIDGEFAIFDCKIRRYDKPVS